MLFLLVLPYRLIVRSIRGSSDVTAPGAQLAARDTRPEDWIDFPTSYSDLYQYAKERRSEDTSDK